MRRILFVTAMALLAAPAALADSATGLGAKAVPYDTGAELYQHVCQGCHQVGAVGAVGAGVIPALAHDPRLKQAAYPILRVSKGYGGMPWFNGLLTTAQIAEVVGYVRTHFGNNYTDPVTEAQVAALAGKPPVVER